MDITSLTQRMHGCSKPWYLFCPRRRTSQALGLRTILPLLPCISSSFHRAALWTGPPVSFLLKQAGKSVARPCPSQARKPPPPTHGCRAPSDTRGSLEGVRQGEASCWLRLLEPSMLSFIRVQRIWFYLLVFILETREGNGTPLQSSCLENPMDGGAW